MPSAEPTAQAPLINPKGGSIGWLGILSLFHDISNPPHAALAWQLLR